MSHPHDTLHICIVVGTRPEIIKMAPVIEACKEAGVPFFLVHTGQHYSEELDRIFFNELRLPPPDYQLGVGSGEPAMMIARMLEGIATVFEKERPTVVLTQGDTNSALAGSLAANKAGIPLAHVEAGLRSYDRTMPEEVNRILIDHMADLLFAPTKTSKANLLAEGISSKRISIVGNTIADVVIQHLPDAAEQSQVLSSHALTPSRFGILTLHRPGNVDEPERLRSILSHVALSWPAGEPLLFLAHPRTLARIEAFGIDVPDALRVLRPVGYREMLSLIANAQLVLTDSGGLQEEACILNVPCVTIRPNTERPETLHIGSNVLVPDLERLPYLVKRMQKVRHWRQPYGRGDAAKRLLSILKNMYG